MLDLSDAPHDPRQVPLAIDLRGVSKRFGGVTALDSVDLQVRRGSIHGLVGENGAGKSTLIKVLAGIHRPDAGSLSLHGQPQSSMTPQLAARAGLQVIHQDRLLVPTFTVDEALFLGDEPTLRGLPLLDRASMRGQAQALLREFFDTTLPPDVLIGELSTAQQQLVQITRALLRQPSILVFDEPTAALVRQEVVQLMRIIRQLRERHITIVYISHYLQEVEELCDSVSILRNGSHIATVDPRLTPAAEIAALMVAHNMRELFPKQATTPGETVLEVSALEWNGVFSDISLSARRGEIVGLTGLSGSGVKELVRCLFGLERHDGGNIIIDGQTVKLRSPADAVRHGVALVPEDRRRQGVALSMRVRENMSLASLARFTRFGFLRRRPENQVADALIARLGVKTAGREAPVGQLSGGNQQKVALAKWLCRQSHVYILDEPTVGVDIGAKIEIYRLLNELVAGGAAVLMLSSDLPELLGMADRILVFYRGRICTHLHAADTSADALLAYITTGRAHTGRAASSGHPTPGELHDASRH